MKKMFLKELSFDQLLVLNFSTQIDNIFFKLIQIIDSEGYFFKIKVQNGVKCKASEEIMPFGCFDSLN